MQLTGRVRPARDEERTAIETGEHDFAISGANVNREVQILPDAAAIARRAAEQIVESAAAAVKERGVFTISLAGGSTPKALYTLLATDAAFKSKMPWDKTQFFFGDERHVPPDDPESNFRMANESMLSKLSLKPEQVLRIKGGIRGRGKGR